MRDPERATSGESNRPWLIYGATGYTGRLAAEHALERGLPPIVAGRYGGRVEALAAQTGLEGRTFALDDPAAIAAGIRGVTAVLHVAGPFSATSRPMADACIAERIHYVDVTGEIAVFEALALRDAEAKAAGVMLLPGAGFDVVPSDCLAVHVARRLPGARRLRISIGGDLGVSRGTARTMIEAAAHGTRVRRGGELVELDRPPRAQADVGAGARPTSGVGWGDVATAWRSTGIPDIEVLFEATPRLTRAAGLPRALRRVLAIGGVRRFLQRRIDRRLPAGPSPARRARARAVIVAEAWDERDAHVASRLETPEAYALTARTSVAIACRAAAGEAEPGFRTPASAFGADFILDFPATRREDL